ncbi:protein-methionine-sulfoxide reductase heme-binding subunit MsrQ [Ochrobactrum sp. Marseille-Q0166]|uniref:protein-methionine-sulfoxide reductase heme-binding subunit MsrQ n=1 Tax=Ochrobactrum sp. Marseille-Q0166 TaxID=2761105 RepID=UPI0016555CBA|nr:protein-methionine-sulfoxide reductase heme-binding subunit MsrQ [Ochrobactrum sp. Marseille-Q0166]MBC8716841.1 protein-methionine-sulfoxide reductase heme-binding subunit MsrQ [Ochrobactrum sp. Marseille-Q0166]
MAAQSRSAYINKLKVWVLYALGFLPAVWAFYLGATYQLGADPIKSFEHMLGLWALRFLILTLLITPVRQITGVSLLRYRRALGLLAFYYVLMHFAVYMVLDQALNISAFIADIIKRPFITIGMVSLAVLVPLALTSNNWSIRKLGRRWVVLHKLVYVAIAGGAIHFLMSVKSWPAEPVIYAAIVAILLLWRVAYPLFKGRKQIKRRPEVATLLKK